MVGVDEFYNKCRIGKLLIPSILMVLVSLGLSVSVCVLDDNLEALLNWTALSGNFGLAKEELEEVILDKTCLNIENSDFFHGAENCKYQNRHRFGLYYREISTPPPESIFS